MRTSRALSLLVTSATLLFGAVACGSDGDDGATATEELARRDMARADRADRADRDDEPARPTTTVKGTRSSIGLTDLDDVTTTTARPTTTTAAPTTTTAPPTTLPNGYSLAVLLADGAAIDQWSTWMDDVSAQVDLVVFYANLGDATGVIVTCGVGSALAGSLPPQIQTDYDLNNYLRQAAAATVELFNSCGNLDVLAMNHAAIAIEEAFLRAASRAVVVAASLPTG